MLDFIVSKGYIDNHKKVPAKDPQAKWHKESKYLSLLSKN